MYQLMLEVLSKKWFCWGVARAQLCSITKTGALRGFNCAVSPKKRLSLILKENSGMEHAFRWKAITFGMFHTQQKHSMAS